MNAPIGDSVGALLGLVAVGVGLALYVWTALALAAMFRKMGDEAWKGWVPFFNQATVLAWGGFSPWLILLLLVLVLGPVAVCVLLIVAAHRINPGFGYGAGMTVVSAVLFVVWASILGFGPARWLGARAGGSRSEGASRAATLGGVFAAEPASPAPVVSTTLSTGAAPTRTRSPPVIAMAPFSLSVTTSSGTFACTAAIAASTSPVSVRHMISASLANSTSISPCSINSWNAPRWRSMTNSAESVKATLRPAARATSIAARIAARGSSGSHR